MIPILSPIRNSPELDALHVAAQEDKHGVTLPSHIVWKGGEIIGYVSLARVPLVHVWGHSQKASARDSLAVLGTIENMFRCANVRAFVTPCSSISPYFPVMPKLGFEPMQGMEWFIKHLAQEKL